MKNDTFFLCFVNAAAKSISGMNTATPTSRATEQEKKPFRILVVEDEKYFRNSLSLKLSKYGQVDEAGNLQEAKQKISQTPYSLAFIDLNLSEDKLRYEGLELVEFASQYNVPSAVLTGVYRKEILEKAYTHGAQKYFFKGDIDQDFDCDVDAFISSMKSINVESFFAKHFITQDKNLIEEVKRVFPSFLRGVPLLIEGPSGVGKSHLGELLHSASQGSKNNFAHINSKEIQDDLAESRLFGHKKGSFTDAKKDTEGFFAKAQDGTLFIDEIGNTPLSLQKTLLQVLQTREYIPVGATKAIRSNCKIITATNADLESLMGEEKFREDFFYRISACRIKIPPLSERPKDIKLLIENELAQKTNKIVIKNSAMEKLLAYKWPGNIRELKNVISALVSGPLGVIYDSDLPVHIQKNILPQAVHEKRLYTQAVSQFISTYGLDAFVKHIEEESFKEALQKNSNRFRNAIKHLRITQYRGYSIKDRIEKRNETPDEKLS